MGFRRAASSLAAPLLAGVVAALALPACGEDEPSYEDTGERMDDAVQRVDRLKSELAEAEADLEEQLAEVERLREDLAEARAELRAAKAGFEEAAERAPADITEVDGEAGGEAGG